MYYRKNVYYHGPCHLTCIMLLSSFPLGDFDATSSLSKSPDERWVKPYLWTMRSHWVPLPLPGPPKQSKRRRNQSPKGIVKRAVPLPCPFAVISFQWERFWKMDCETEIESQIRSVRLKEKACIGVEIHFWPSFLLSLKKRVTDQRTDQRMDQQTDWRMDWRTDQWIVRRWTDIPFYRDAWTHLTMG